MAVPGQLTPGLAYADYLSEAGLNTCIYCPKEDPYLRRQWQSDWPQPKWAELQQLSQTYRSGASSGG